MQRSRFIAVTIAGALLAVATGPQGPLGAFWGPEPTPGLEGPTMGALLLYAILEAIAFGAGIAWLAFGRRIAPLPTSAHLAVGWMLVSWYPHGALHQSIAHTNYAGLVGIEYGFHLTMILAAVVVARGLLQTRATQPSPA